MPEESPHVAEPTRDKTNPITVLVLEDAAGRVGLKIPEFDIEMYGEDLPELIEQVEEHLWLKLEAGGPSAPETATLAIKRVSKEEFGPTCFEVQAGQEDWLGEE